MSQALTVSGCLGRVIVGVFNQTAVTATTGRVEPVWTGAFTGPVAKGGVIPFTIPAFPGVVENGESHPFLQSSPSSALWSLVSPQQAWGHHHSGRSRRSPSSISIITTKRYPKQRHQCLHFSPSPLSSALVSP
jgi:hypothetical protein